MENIHNNINQNNVKLKIKNIFDLHYSNLNLKVFPTLTINSNNKSNSNGIIYINNNIKRNSLSTNKNNIMEKITNENISLKKRIEILEEENKKLKEENRELKEKKEEEFLNNSFKNKNKINIEQSNNPKIFNNYAIKFNNNLLTTASRYFINLRKATLLNDFTNSMNHERAYTISNTIESPKINNNKLFKLSNSINRNQINLTNSLDNDYDIKVQLNNIQKRIKKLLNKYSKYVK